MVGRDESMATLLGLLDMTRAGRGRIAFIVGELGLAARHFEVGLDLRIPTAMGLGSSAAASVAIVRAFDTAFGLQLGDAEVNRIAFACEKLAHGNPSGIDNTLATWGRPVLFRRSASPQVRRITLTEQPPLVVAASGVRGITRDQVGAVAQRHRHLHAPYESLFDQIDGFVLGLSPWAVANLRFEVTQCDSEEGKRRAAAMKSTWRRGQHFEWTDDFDSWDRCITRGLPASMLPMQYNNGIEIHQAPGYVVMEVDFRRA